MVSVEPEIGHLADPDAIEQHCGAIPQAGQGVVKLVVDHALAEATGVVERVDEAQLGRGNRCVTRSTANVSVK